MEFFGQGGDRGGEAPNFGQGGGRLVNKVLSGGGIEKIAPGGGIPPLPPPLSSVIQKAKTQENVKTQQHNTN